MKTYFDLLKPERKAVMPCMHNSPVVHVFPVLTSTESSGQEHSFEKINGISAKVSLPGEMIKNLSLFFEKKLQDLDLSCFEFVMFLISGRYENFSKLKMNISFPEEYQPGDLVVLGNSRKTFFLRRKKMESIDHYMVCLGDNLYLSKIGDKYEVVVANINTLKKLYWHTSDTAKIEMSIL